MTPEEIAAIEGRLGKITPPPWEMDGRLGRTSRIWAPNSRTPQLSVADQVFGRDAKFITHAPDDIAALLEHVKAQDAEIERLGAQVATVEQESIRSAAYALNEYFGDSSLASTLWLLARADEIAYRAALSGASDD